MFPQQCFLVCQGLKPGSNSLRSKRSQTTRTKFGPRERGFRIRAARKNGARAKRWKERDGGEERRERLPANPSILKNPSAHERDSWLVRHGYFDWQVFKFAWMIPEITRAWLAQYLWTSQQRSIWLGVDGTYSILRRRRHLLEGKYLVALSPAGFNESFSKSFSCCFNYRSCAKIKQEPANL